MHKKMVLQKKRGGRGGEGIKEGGKHVEVSLPWRLGVSRQVQSRARERERGPEGKYIQESGTRVEKLRFVGWENLSLENQSKPLISTILA